MAAVASTVASCARAASSARVPSRRGGPGRLSRAAPTGAKSARGGSVVPSAFTPAGAKIAGVGMELPAQSLTNDDLASLVDTNDEWIRTRTGIGKRHVISGDESLTSLASGAAKKALTMANVDAEDVDVIILATSSPDDAFGSACTVQAEIGATGALAYDLTAACSGFVVGMVNAVHFLRGGEYQHVLVIGADALSRYVDWRDRGTCILFGDGAGACVLSKTDDPNDCCLLGFDMHSDGTGNGNLTAAFVSESNTEKTAKPTSESQTAASAVGAFANVQMNGQEVFKFAVRAVPDTLTRTRSRRRACPRRRSTTWCCTRRTSGSSTARRRSSASARKRWCPTSRSTGTPARDPCPSPGRRRWRRGGSSRGTSSQPPGLALG